MLSDELDYDWLLSDEVRKVYENTEISNNGLTFTDGDTIVTVTNDDLNNVGTNDSDIGGINKERYEIAKTADKKQLTDEYINTIMSNAVAYFETCSVGFRDNYLEIDWYDYKRIMLVLCDHIEYLEKNNVAKLHDVASYAIYCRKYGDRYSVRDSPMNHFDYAQMQGGDWPDDESYSHAVNWMYNGLDRCHMAIYATSNIDLLKNFQKFILNLLVEIYTQKRE